MPYNAKITFLKMHFRNAAWAWTTFLSLIRYGIVCIECYKQDQKSNICDSYRWKNGLTLKRQGGAESAHIFSNVHFFVNKMVLEV